MQSVVYFVLKKLKVITAIFVKSLFLVKNIFIIKSRRKSAKFFYQFLINFLKKNMKKEDT